MGADVIFICTSRWWFQIFLFSPLLGEDFQFDDHIFQMGWSHQPVLQSDLRTKGFSAVSTLANWYRIQLCYMVVWKVKCRWPWNRALIIYPYLLVSGNVPKYLRCNLEKGYPSSWLGDILGILDQVQHCHNTSPCAPLWWTHSSLWFANRSANSWDAVAWFLSSKKLATPFFCLWGFLLLSDGNFLCQFLFFGTSIGRKTICNLRFRQGRRDQHLLKMLGSLQKWLGWLGLGSRWQTVCQSQVVTCFSRS